MFATLVTTIALFSAPAQPASADAPSAAAPTAQTAVLADAPAQQSDTITLGDCGEPVAKLEQKLEDLHYLLSRFATGCYEGAVSQGVMALQKHEGIDRDGVFGPQTAETLKKAKQPQPPAGGEPTRVDVDISDQLAYVVIGGDLKTVLSIASGIPGLDTPKGKFSVYRKEEMSWSRPYKTWMPWASYFNGGIALHENAAVYGYPASHGCVRVPPPFAEWLYGVAAMGTQVRVLG